MVSETLSGQATSLDEYPADADNYVDDRTSKQPWTLSDANDDHAEKKSGLSKQWKAILSQ